MAEKRTILRRMQRPWVSAALLVVLLIDFGFALWSDRGIGAVSRAIGWRMAHISAQVEQFGEDFHFVLEGDGLVPLFRDGESADRFAKLTQNEPQRVLGVWLHARKNYGVWATAYVDRDVSVFWFDGHPVHDVTWQRAIALLALELESRGDTASVAELRAFPHGTRRWLWSGAAYNAAGLGVLAAFVLSLGWLPAWLRSFRKQPWQCRRCGYDLRGIAANTCPECGELR